mmetsp:Transcript_8776/g.23816  ORF Transcript_8776/g.23816 Transcript_8776/m.23816 type:complete len:222 (+) Transcript_8776:904-1569(+)
MWTQSEAEPSSRSSRRAHVRSPPSESLAPRPKHGSPPSAQPRGTCTRHPQYCSSSPAWQRRLGQQPWPAAGSLAPPFPSQPCPGCLQARHPSASSASMRRQSQRALRRAGSGTEPPPQGRPSEHQRCPSQTDPSSRRGPRGCCRCASCTTSRRRPGPSGSWAWPPSPAAPRSSPTAGAKPAGRLRPPAGAGSSAGQRPAGSRARRRGPAGGCRGTWGSAAG